MAQTNDYMQAILSRLFPYCYQKNELGILARKKISEKITFLIRMGYLEYLEDGIRRIVVETGFWSDGLAALLNSLVQDNVRISYPIEYLNTIRELINVFSPSPAELASFYLTGSFFFEVSVDEFKRQSDDVWRDFSKFIDFAFSCELKREQPFLSDLIVRRMPRIFSFETIIAMPQWKGSTTTPLAEGFEELFKENRSKVDEFFQKVIDAVKDNNDIMSFLKNLVKKLFPSYPDEIRKFINAIKEKPLYFFELATVVNPNDDEIGIILKFVIEDKLEKKKIIELVEKCDFKAVSKQKSIEILFFLEQNNYDKAFIQLINKCCLSSENEFIMLKEKKLLSDCFLNGELIDFWQDQCIDYLQKLQEKERINFLNQVVKKISDNLKNLGFNKIINFLIKHHLEQVWPTIKTWVTRVDLSNSVPSYMGKFSFGRSHWMLDRSELFDKLVEWCKEDSQIPPFLANNMCLLEYSASSPQTMLFGRQQRRTDGWNQMAMYLIVQHWTPELGQSIYSNLYLFTTSAA